MPERSGGSVGYSLCMHIPSVQFLDWSTVPSQSFPPFLGVGALHSLLLQWVHSVPQVDHLLHSVHRPSTSTQQTRTDGGRADDIADGMRGMRIAQVGGWAEVRSQDRRERNTCKGGAKYADTQPHQMLEKTLGRRSPSISDMLLQFPVVTWAERITRQLLDALTFTDGAAVERGGVGAAARAFLETAATAAVAHGPFGPRRPSSVDCGLDRDGALP